MDFVDYDVDYNYNNGHGAPPTTTHSSPQTDLLSNYKCVLLANYPVNSTSYSTLNYYSLWLLSSNPLFPTSEFTPLHHLSFQVSQLILCVYVCVCKKSVLSFIILSCYAVVMGFWGLFVLKSVDICVWNASVLAFVLVRLCASCVGGKGGRKSPGGRRVKGASNGKGVVVSGSSYGVKCGGAGGTGAGVGVGGGAVKDDALQDVYLRLFAPVRVSYKQFRVLLGCKRGLQVLGCGENYSVEKRSRVDSLGLLLSGRLVVCQGGKPLHVILPFQFVDSPEYFGVATDELFQVTITALEESRLLVWHRDKLRLTIMSDEFLSIIFQHILSRDVCRKLISVSDTMVTTPTTTTYTASNSSSTGISSSSSCSSSSAQQSAPSTNGSAASTIVITTPSTNGAPSNLLTTITPSTHHGSNNTGSSATPVNTTSRKDKYSYQPTYLTSLSEEKLRKHAGGFNEEEDDDEEDEEDDEEDELDDEEEEYEEHNHDASISGNEKIPMLEGKALIVTNSNADK